MATPEGAPVDDGLGPRALASARACVARVLGDGGRLADDLGAELVAAYRSGREAWPTAQISIEGFAGAVLERAAAAQGDARASVAAMRLDEVYLASACAAGDTGAILAFEGAFFGEIARAFPARSHGEAFLEDARQNLRERLFVASAHRPPGIGSYAGRGSLRGWFRFALTHHTLNLKRHEARAPTPTAQDLEPALLVPLDPELLHLRQRYSAEFRAAAAEAVERLSADDRQALRHHYVERLGIDGIAAIHGIHRVTAARRVNRARDALVLLVRQSLTSRLHVGETELESILRLLPTQLSMSLERVLGPQGGEGATPPTTPQR